MLQPHQPRTTPELLRLLGVQDASAERHMVVLAEWLLSNTPSADLQLSLRANGYGQVLPHPKRGWNPWKPVQEAS
jgi:hypothetical protein